MVILVLSCDKNEDIFKPFYHCMEKYYPTHPIIFYATETINNPYYFTINKNYPLNQWTRRIRETLSEIEDDQILLMVDDCFIRKPVDTKRIEYISHYLNNDNNIAMFNFEKSFDSKDEETEIKGFKKRSHGSDYELSLLCGLWNKKKLMQVLSKDSDPWTVEYNQNTYNYDYYINSEDYIIDWGYITWKPAGLYKGKWCKEIIPFFEKEGIKIKYDERGFSQW